MRGVALAVMLISLVLGAGILMFGALEITSGRSHGVVILIAGAMIWLGGVVALRELR